MRPASFAPLREILAGLPARRRRGGDGGRRRAARDDDDVDEEKGRWKHDLPRRIIYARTHQVLHTRAYKYPRACPRSAIDKRNLFPFYIPVSPIINCYAMSATEGWFTAAAAMAARGCSRFFPFYLFPPFFRDEGGAIEPLPRKRTSERRSNVVINYTRW